MSVVPPFMEGNNGNWYLTQQYVPEGPLPPEEPLIMAMEIAPLTDFFEEVPDEDRS